jgi:uncharacterized protein
MPASPSRTTLSRRQLLVATGALAAGILAGGSVIDAYRFRIVRLAVRAAGLREPLRVVFLTDLHFGVWIHRASVSAWVDAALKESPDLVVLGGDIVDQTAGADVSPLLDELARLRAPLGTYAVRGNHDHRRFPDTDVFAGELASAGVDVLVNRGVGLRNDLYLAGIDDLRLGRPDLRATLADWPPGRACLLVSHNPDVLPDVPETVSLTLSGHTHGGQVCIPLFGPIVTNSRYGNRFVHGLVRAPALGYVSRGLGVTALPVRVACPAELTVIDLDPRAPDPTAPAFASADG